jgi:hypothetical protein
MRHHAVGPTDALHRSVGRAEGGNTLRNLRRRGITCVGVVRLRDLRCNVEASVGEEQYDFARRILERGGLGGDRLVHARERGIEVGVETTIAIPEPVELGDDRRTARAVERLPAAVRVKVVGEAGEKYVDGHTASCELRQTLHRDLSRGDALGSGITARLMTRRVAETSRLVEHEREQQLLVLREALPEGSERGRRRRTRGVRRSRRERDDRSECERADEQPPHR